MLCVLNSSFVMYGVPTVYEMLMQGAPLPGVGWWSALCMAAFLLLEGILAMAGSPWLIYLQTPLLHFGVVVLPSIIGFLHEYVSCLSPLLIDAGQGGSFIGGLIPK